MAFLESTTFESLKLYENKTKMFFLQNYLSFLRDILKYPHPHSIHRIPLNSLQPLGTLFFHSRSDYYFGSLLTVSEAVFASVGSLGFVCISWSYLVLVCFLSACQRHSLHSILIFTKLRRKSKISLEVYVFLNVQQG